MSTTEAVPARGSRVLLPTPARVAPAPLGGPALACAAGSGVVAAVLVAHERSGLGLTLALWLVIGATVLGAQRRPSPVFAVLAAGLALQPLLRDAGWVVAISALAAIVATSTAVTGPDDWRRLRRALLAPLRMFGGTVIVARALAALTPTATQARAAPIVKGLALALVLSAAFGGLFATADQAFAELAGNALSLDWELGRVTERALLGLLLVVTAGALVSAGVPTIARIDLREQANRAGCAPGRVETLIALSAVVAVFGVFVGVQLRVLFGGAEYVRVTTGLGLGEYARQGFVQLLFVAALTLAVIAVAARRRERSVRVLLGALCVLTLVVLLSAHLRLGLLEDAYGFTRVRYAGHAIVIWLAAVFALVLAAGTVPALARRLPRIATTLTLAWALAFALSNPDARIARSAVDREATSSLDLGSLAGLSADALPALEQLPSPERAIAVPPLRARLTDPDGIGGLNLARIAAR